PLSDEAFRDKLAPAAKEFVKGDWTTDSWNSFAQRLHYVPGDATATGGIDALRNWLNQAEGKQPGRRLYYLSVSPELYGSIATRLGEEGMSAPVGATGWRRLVIEKPFGKDLASAQELNQTLQRHFREDQIYRIDHYLGKETVQNILVFR